MDVLDNDGWLDVQLPVDVWEGAGTVSGSVILGGSLGADLVVTLTSSDSLVLEVPATVTIPAGQTTATIVLTVPDDSLPDGAHTATVTAAAVGLPDDSVQVTIHDDELHHFAWGTIGSPQTAGVAFAGTLEARNVDNEKIVPFTGTAGVERRRQRRGRAGGAGHDGGLCRGRLERLGHRVRLGCGRGADGRRRGRPHGRQQCV